MSTSASTREYRFIEPLDVLFLRGNKLFGDPGSYGECLIPPWPSVAAGAIRSRMLVDDGIDLTKFECSEINHPSLGTPKSPGSFMLAGFYLARKTADHETEILMPPPADLVIAPDETHVNVSQLTPQVISSTLQSSFPLDQLPVLAQGAQRSKPQSGYWLTQSGWKVYLQGGVPAGQQLVHSSELWSLDARVGIGMSEATRSVESGKLFSAQAVVMHKPGNRIRNDNKIGKPLIADYTVGFLAAVSGAVPPKNGLLRFGGDGRAASLSPAEVINPEVLEDYGAIAEARRCRLVLTSPGMFPGGWKLPVTDNSNRVVLPGNIHAKLVSAAVPRAEMVSGWDLANWQPKAAQRVAPTGSVYWLEELEARSGSLDEALSKLEETGLWVDPCEDDGRRVEGFNRCAIGVWI